MDTLVANIKSTQFLPVVSFDHNKDKLQLMDFTAANKALTAAVFSDTHSFSQYVNEQLGKNDCRYGIGGYMEHRTIYAKSVHFDGEEPRRIHLGIDIWSKAGTPVFAPMGGLIHSFAFNNNDGDYGATLILQHQLNGNVFHTLYGHIALKDIEGLTEGKYIDEGECIAHFGEPHENGNWPPHLHFQVIIDMEMMMGDYPGVCAASEKNKYAANCPDPDFILNMMQYAVQ